MMIARLLLPLVLLTGTAAHADWLHYRGPAGNGTSVEKGFSIPTGEPRVLWRAKVGTGTSGIVVSGGRAFTIGNPDGKSDVVFCLDAATGKEVWRHTYPLELDPNLFEGGPRSTPTVDGNRVFTVSHQGDAFCLDAATGKPVWYAHLQRDFGGRRPEWGFSGSITIAGNLALYDAGVNLALDKTTGKPVWKTGGEKTGYTCAVVAKIGGTDTAVWLKGERLVGLELKSGRELWSYPWKTSYDVNAATPVVAGDRVLITSGYNRGAALIEVKGGKASRVWENKNLRAHVNSPVIIGAHAYGIDGNTGGGNLVCLDLATGERAWEEKSVKGGSLIAADGKLIIISEKGELVICEASPAGFKQLGRAQVQGRRHWTQPTLVAGRLFVRNNDGDLTCVDLGAK